MSTRKELINALIQAIEDKCNAAQDVQTTRRYLKEAIAKVSYSDTDLASVAKNYVDAVTNFNNAYIAKRQAIHDLNVYMDTQVENTT